MLTVLATFRGSSGRGVAVVLGGSVAEGQPGLRGLHHGQRQNRLGQISFALQGALRMPVLNQGIGGQTCGEIMARWNTDVPPDTRLVWFNCGHNDFSKSPSPVEAIQSSLRLAKTLADARGIRLVVQNLGPNPKHEAEVEEINRWLETLGVTVVDFHQWALRHRDLFADALHPTKEGYISFMAEQRTLLHELGRE